MIDVALVGCGHMGRLHARTITAAPGTRLVAVCDRNVERALAIAALTGARAVSEVPAEVDAVVIATPTSAHLTYMVHAIERGQWCLVEKPMVPSVAAFAAMAPPLDRVVVGHIERFNPAIRSAGAPAFSSFRALRQSAPGRGGDIDVVLDLMIHDLDLFLWLSGTPAPQITQVSGTRGPSGLWDQVCVHLETADVHAEIESSRIARSAARSVVLTGSSRPVRLDLLAGHASSEGVRLPRCDSLDGLSAQWRGFTAAMTGQPTQVARGADGLRALQLAEQVLDALRSTA